MHRRRSRKVITGHAKKRRIEQHADMRGSINLWKRFVLPLFRWRKGGNGFKPGHYETLHGIFNHRYFSSPNSTILTLILDALQLQSLKIRGSLLGIVLGGKRIQLVIVSYMCICVLYVSMSVHVQNWETSNLEWVVSVFGRRRSLEKGWGGSGREK